MAGHDCPFEKRFPSELERDDPYFMWQAYNLAIDAWRRDEVPVGAVIAKDGTVIAAAHNQTIALKDPTAHAELLAVTQAAQALGDWRLTGATLYVTKEPCPMCSGAAVMARLSRVVFAMADPKMGCCGGAVALHTVDTFNHHPDVTGGVLEGECRQLMQAFFQLKRGGEAGAREAAWN
ncbi:MAG TPA: nucleoside deaminase [Verrucomicrobiae bacterium]|nr:nucleoside deaminase [Verrucomicrobiae bacterium]